MDSEKVKEIFKERKLTHNIDFDPKDEQIRIAVSVLNNRNVIGLLPTGFGKTFCMVLPTLVQMETNPITLVISPLTSLIDDNISSLRNWNFKCAKLEALVDMDEQCIAGITRGDYHFVYSSPESVLKPYWKKKFLNETWQSKTRLIVIDEAHCISEWGEDFRSDYQHLHELRSFFSVPIMTLTATSTKKVKDDIMEHLQLADDDTDIIFKSPNRPNIFIEVRKKESTDYEVALKWLIDHIKKNGKNSKKTIVYCRSIDRVSETFMTLKDSLGLHAYLYQIKHPQNILVEMFHKSTYQDSKDRIISEFKSNNSTIRCLVATVALGMGLDIRDVDLIVHVGCPKSVLSYWQEAGRCARDGRNGFSLILYDHFTLSLKTTGKDMANIVKKHKDNKCIRKEIISLLLSVGEVEKLDTNHCEGCDGPCCTCSACSCCSVCSSKCKCQERCKFDIEKFLSEDL